MSAWSNNFYETKLLEPFSKCGIKHWTPITVNGRKSYVIETTKHNCFYATPQITDFIDMVLKPKLRAAKKYRPMLYQRAEDSYFFIVQTGDYKYSSNGTKYLDTTCYYRNFFNW